MAEQKEKGGLLNTPTAIVLAGFLIAVGYYISNNGLSLPQSNTTSKPATSGQAADQAQIGPVRDFFTAYAAELGLDEPGFASCLDNQKYQDQIQVGLAQGQGLGITGTLGFFINGRLISGAHSLDTFQEFIDKELAGEASSNPADYSEVIQQIDQQSPGIFGFEPVEVEISADDPVLGDAQAPVTMVEFSDYQCPFCQRAFAQTLPAIKNQYVETGKVKYVIKDFPLTNIHPNAQGAALAARCAGEQEAYWEMHDLLFERQDEWSNASPLQ